MALMSDYFHPERRQQIANVWRLSVPAILTQISAIVMQYIDSAMVGRLGADASAAIGLVASSMWLLQGLCQAAAAGFSVQVAYHIGAGDEVRARRVLRYGLLSSTLLSLLLGLLAAAISFLLPVWLGGAPEICRDAGLYFLVFACSMPFFQWMTLASAVLQCSGNMVTPSVLNAVMCGLDVVFNALFIPRFGVLGAGLGTALATAVISLVLLWFCCVRTRHLNILHREKSPFEKDILLRALRIGLPVGAEQAAMCGAMVVSMGIVSPLGTEAIAAHSFAITAEGLCYMPGYGIAAAATTLVGQRMGARENKAAKQYGNIAIALGCGVMTGAAVLMFIFCPFVFRMLTPVEPVQQLATAVLRIGLIAEPLYGVSIVASGALRGAEDTLVPSILNLLSIWVVRLGLAVILVKAYGLYGMWIAMATELCVRGLLLLGRQIFSRHYDKVR